MKYVIGFLLIFVSFLLLQPAYTTELKCYTSQNPPLIYKKAYNDRLYKTDKNVTFPIGIKVQYFIDEFRKDITDLYDHTFPVNVTQYSERIFLANGMPETLEEIYLCLEYFYIEIPTDISRVKPHHFKAVGSELKEAKLYKRIIYQLPPVQTKSKIIIDAPGIAFYKTKELSQPNEVAFKNDNGENDLARFGAKYCGYILSVFHKEKLLYQATNQKKLQDKGLEKLTDQIYKRHMYR